MMIAGVADSRMPMCSSGCEVRFQIQLGKSKEIKTPAHEELGRISPLKNSGRTRRVSRAALPFLPVRAAQANLTASDAPAVAGARLALRMTALKGKEKNSGLASAGLKPAIARPEKLFQFRQPG
jgi:hypothetical protein